MNRKVRPIKSFYQIKQEQVNFLLEDIEKKLEENKKAVEVTDNQLTEAKEVLKGAKRSYDSLVKENKQLKEYIKRFKQYQQQQQQQEFLQDKEYSQRPQKRYKKIVYEEETDSEPEAEESQYAPEDEPIEQKKEKNKYNLKIKEKIKYLVIETKMQREISHFSDKVFVPLMT